MFQIKKRSVVAVAITSAILVGCGGGGGSESSSDAPSSITSPNVNGTPSLKAVSAYQSTELSDDVVDCSKAFLDQDSCDLSIIQPIGVTPGDVTIEQIKERLVVSHSWMAESFIDALEEINDQDLLNLFKPLNTIVVSYDVRPSFYTTSTASMYIDPRYVWRNKSEWDSIHQQDDYRQSFQTEFQFDNARRYVEQGTHRYVTYSNNYSSRSNATREARHIAPGLFRLLSHELAHANDFLQSDDLIQIPDTGMINDYISPLNKLNQDLRDRDPLVSDLLFDAAQVAFRGAPMTDQIRNLTGEVAGGEFEGDKAAAFYSYSHPAEDVAMLFEAYMMYKKYGAISDVAFVSIPQFDNASCNDWVIQWGQRSRLSDPSVQDRAVFVTNRILNKSVDTISRDLASLPASPTAFTTGIGWCESQQILDASFDARVDNFEYSDSQRYLEDFEE